jgi:hypothetical protein
MQATSEKCFSDSRVPENVSPKSKSIEVTSYFSMSLLDFLALSLRLLPRKERKGGVK